MPSFSTQAPNMKEVGPVVEISLAVNSVKTFRSFNESF